VQDLICDSGGGMIELNNLSLSSVDFSADTCKGKVVIGYKLNRFFACAGDEVEKIKKETLDIYIDTERNELIFSLFEPPKS
jgi:hypothetical protein